MSLIHASEVISMSEVNGRDAYSWVGNIIQEPEKYKGAVIKRERLDANGNSMTEEIPGAMFSHGYLEILLKA